MLILYHRKTAVQNTTVIMVLPKVRETTLVVHLVEDRPFLVADDFLALNIGNVAVETILVRQAVLCEEIARATQGHAATRAHKCFFQRQIDFLAICATHRPSKVSNHEVY